MTQPQTSPPNLAEQRQTALSTWDGEGGAGVMGPQEEPASSAPRSGVPDLDNSELERMHIRLIALENLVIALLAGASEQQLELARDAVDYISPRPGTTPHPLTMRGARQMSHLIKQAAHFRSITEP